MDLKKLKIAMMYPNDVPTPMTLLGLHRLIFDELTRAGGSPKNCAAIARLASFALNEVGLTSRILFVDVQMPGEPFKPPIEFGTIALRPDETGEMKRKYLFHVVVWCEGYLLDFQAYPCIVQECPLGSSIISHSPVDYKIAWNMFLKLDEFNDLGLSKAEHRIKQRLNGVKVEFPPPPQKKASSVWPFVFAGAGVALVVCLARKR